MMLNAAGGNLSIRYGLRGINYSVATACASANNAIGDALKAIQYGDADVIVTARVWRLTDAPAAPSPRGRKRRYALDWWRC